MVILDKPVDTDESVDVDAGTPLEAVAEFAEMPMGTWSTYKTAKACQLIDLNLFVSSSDFFRDSVGGYFYTTTDGDTEEISLNFTPFEYGNPRNSHLKYVVSYTGSNIDAPLPDGASYGTFIPNSTFVVSVHGDTDVITDDAHWKTLWTGGVIDDVNYKPLLNTATYEDHYTLFQRPYAQINTHILKEAASLTNWVDVSYEYKHYLRDYQSYANNADSELYLPNWYLLKHAGIFATGSGDLLGGVYNYLSSDGTAPDVWSYFLPGGPAIVNNRQDMADTAVLENIDSELSPVIGYLNSFFTSSLSTTTQEYAKKKFQNVFFPASFYDEYGEYSKDITGSMPYYNTVSFTTDANATSPSNELFAQYAHTYGFDTLLLRLLKEAFLEQDPEAIAPHSLEYNKYLEYLSSSVGSDVDQQINEYSNVNYRAVNLVDLLLYSYHKINDSYEDFVVISQNDLQTQAAYDTNGSYRYYNTTATTKFMNATLGTSMVNILGIANISSLLNSQAQYNTDPALEYSGTPNPKYNEVIAYRIEKTGITNPDVSTSPSQNFWFFNWQTTSGGDVELFDTQVKYDKDYTYKIYSYNIVVGLKYRYSNLQLSRVIGMAADLDTASPGVPGTEGVEDVDTSGYCIEYYDPLTDASVNDLISPGIYGPAMEYISDLATEAQRVVKDLWSPESRPYRANFQVTIEPSIKIMEIPVYEKTHRIMDHPPNYVSITPSFTKDDTNRLAFFGSYQQFVEDVYPHTISGADVLQKEQYLNANNMVDSSLIEKPTISPQATIDVYRIQERPTSYTSFDGHFLRTISLTTEEFDAAYTDIYFYDIVKSNTKYYYLFRISNDNGMTGYFEEVLEAELINDGGYKYAIFDTLFEEDFEEESFVETLKPAKSLFQLSPAAAQRSLNTQNVDYSNSAEDEYEKVTVGEAEDLIWNKTFKVRLTSKKTNKKIDLNIKYLQTDDNY